MLYTAYELAYAAVTPARIAAGVGAKFWRSPFNPVADSWFGRSAAAALDVFENVMRRYPKPEWGLDSTVVNGVDVPVMINEAVQKDFCTLLHFERDRDALNKAKGADDCLLYTSPSPRDLSTSRMPSSA